MANNRFGVSGVYKCVGCGKRTRDTSDIPNDICPSCYEEVVMENDHNDGYHKEPHAKCPWCKPKAS